MVDAKDIRDVVMFTSTVANFLSFGSDLTPRIPQSSSDPAPRPSPFLS